MPARALTLRLESLHPPRRRRRTAATRSGQVSGVTLEHWPSGERLRDGSALGDLPEDFVLLLPASVESSAKAPVFCSTSNSRTPICRLSTRSTALAAPPTPAGGANPVSAPSARMPSPVLCRQEVSDAPRRSRAANSRSWGTSGELSASPLADLDARLVELSLVPIRPGARADHDVGCIRDRADVRRFREDLPVNDDLDRG